jgi:hypothetical protein
VVTERGVAIGDMGGNDEAKGGQGRSGNGALVR